MSSAEFWFTMIVYVFPVMGLVAWKLRERRGQRQIIRARAAQSDDERINTKLWELLKDEDPAWLIAMGIEKPKAVERWEEKPEPGAVILVNSPADTIVFPAAQNADRAVEAKLEARLQQLNRLGTLIEETGALFAEEPEHRRVYKVWKREWQEKKKRT